LARKNWRRRLFILTENGDWTYVNEKEKIAGVIHLFSYNELEFATKETGKNFAFKILHKSDPNVRPFYVFADTKEDMDSWVETISKLANIRTQGSATPTPTPHKEKEKEKEKDKEKEKEKEADHDEFFVSKTRLNEMLVNIQRVERELEERRALMEQEWRKVQQMKDEVEQAKKDAQEEWQQAREARQKAKQVLEAANETSRKAQETKSALEAALKHSQNSSTTK